MKCPEYEYYVCSFWLKFGKSEDSEIKLTVKSTEFGSSTDEGRATFDNTAANSWQLVQIPIKISRREIDSIRFELPKTTNYKIADMRLTYAPSVSIESETERTTTYRWMKLRKSGFKRQRIQSL